MAIKIQLTREEEDMTMFGAETVTKTKQVPFGFSWTTLFFGCIPCIFRGDWLNTLVVMTASFLITITGVLALMVASTAGYTIVSVICAILWIFVAGRVNYAYNRSLAKSWYLDWEGTLRLNPGVDRNELRTQLAVQGYYFK